MVHCLCSSFPPPLEAKELSPSGRGSRPRSALLTGAEDGGVEFLSFRETSKDNLANACLQSWTRYERFVDPRKTFQSLRP